MCLLLQRVFVGAATHFYRLLLLALINRHYPYSPLALRSKYDGRLSDNTISIRIYALDCPETANFGNKAQPMADEATEFTRKLVDKKVVRIKLLRRDQYNRAVAKVFVKYV